MSGELEKLLIRLEADTTLLRRAMKDAEAGIDGFEAKANSGTSRAEKRFQAAGSAIESSLRKVGAALAATATVAQAWDLTKQAAALDGLAKTAGLNTDQFQEFRNAAASAGVEFDKFNAASAHFAENMAEARTKTGGFYEFLKASAPSLNSQLQATKSQADAYRVLSDFVASLSRSEEKALVLKKAFGDSSPDFISALEKTAAAYRNMGTAASDYSDVVTREAIQASKALKREIDEVSRSWTTAFQNAIGQAGAGIAAGLASARAEVGEFAKNIGRTGSSIPENTRPVVVSLDRWATSFKGAAEATDSWAKAASKANGIRLEQKLPPWQTSVDFSAADKLAALRQASATARGEDFEAIRQDTEQQIEEVRRLMTNDLTGRLNDEAEFNEARVLINEAAGRRIADANQRLLDEDRARFAEMEGLIKNSIGGAIEEAVKTGKVSWGSLLADMLAGAARIMTEMLVLKPIMDSVFSSVRGSSLASLFNMSTANSGFGGGRAAGGPVLGGVPHLVGENGPEIFVPNTSGTVVVGGGSAGSSVTYNIDARGADIGAAERVQAALAAARGSQRDPVRSVTDYRQRFPGRAAA